MESRVLLALVVAVGEGVVISVVVVIGVLTSSFSTGTGGGGGKFAWLLPNFFMIPRSMNVMLFFRGFLSFFEVPADMDDLRLLLTSSLALLLMIEFRPFASAPGSGGGGSRVMVDVRGLDTDLERPARVLVRNVVEDGVSEEIDELRCCKVDKRLLSRISSIED